MVMQDVSEYVIEEYRVKDCLYPPTDDTQDKCDVTNTSCQLKFDVNGDLSYEFRTGWWCYPVEKFFPAAFSFSMIDRCAKQ